MGTLSDIRLFLLDLDGTFYLDGTPLPGALDFLTALRAKGVPFAFLTNNSSRGREEYLDRLNAMGAQITGRELLTSADATLDYLAREGFDRELLLVGTPSLEAQFAAAGYQLHSGRPKAVVLGFDTTLTYQKLVDLCNAVRAGLPYIATHPDFNCPVKGGFIPDIGGVIALVEACTGRRPDAVIGKPNAFIAEAAADRFGVPLAQICMVGDRLYTDIALGGCGVKTALVLSGETSSADYEKSEIRADFVFDGIWQMAAAL
ncbi:MAG TPA: HAD-IIA family hydrolase [Candidatus Pygmaiobacter gallistercoris]|nr:HAD-IIA family hydrolase [Candidatus Pygmaiobacter gallistercoris]